MESELTLEEFESFCVSCNFTLDERIALAGDNWEYFKANTDEIPVFFDQIVGGGNIGGCSNPWAYAICCAACVASFGELPPLCVFCIWECACMYCPSPYIGCPN